jgi:two-component system response regulator YesN
LYKVIIVDDEPTIREGLRTLIAWEQFGFQVVDVAANGNDAISKFQSMSPDLMIVDIRMPGMNGLQLVEAIRNLNNNMHFLILSGYADFDYAQKAIKSRVDEYMLKPIDESELIEYLQQLGNKLDKEIKEKQRDIHIREWDREKLIKSYLSSHPPENPAEIMDNGLLWSAYQILLIKLYSVDEIALESETIARKRLEDFFEKSEEGILFSLDSYLGILLNLDLISETNSSLMYHDLAKIISESGFNFCVAAGSKVTCFDELKVSYDAALKLIKQQFFLEEGQILSAETKRVFSKSSKKQHSEKALDLVSIVDKLYYALEIGSRDAVQQLIFESAGQMVEMGDSEHEIKSSFVQVLSALLGKLAIKNPVIQTENQAYSSSLMGIHKQHNLHAMLLHILQFFDHLIQTAEKVDTDMQLKKMVDLIQRNCHENLKLEALAKVFNYNSAYLGKIFKNYTGEYFNTYLDKIRIEKSKLLLDQGLKVYQVAERVGYANVDYFHSKFKHHEGISPTAYRKNNSVGNQI